MVLRETRMTAVLDVNVRLDVFQNCQPRYGALTKVWSMVFEAGLKGRFPARGATPYFTCLRNIERAQKQ